MKLIAWLVLPVSLWGQSSHPAFWRFTHPEAQLLLGADFERIGSSPFGQRLKKEMAAAGIEKAIAAQGLDFLPAVDRVLISSPASDTADGKSGRTPAVVAFSGRFDVLKIRRQLTAKGARRSFYKGVELFARAGQPGDMIIGLVNGQIMLLGDPASVKAAIENHRNTEPGTAQNELFQRATELSRNFDVWFLSDVSPTEVEEFKFPGLESLAGAVSALQGGISLRDGLMLELSLGTEDEETAKQLSAALQGAVRLGLAGALDGDPRSRDDLLSRLRFGSSDGWVMMTLTFPEKELEAGFDQMLAARSGKVQAAPVPAKQEPPPPLVVKIHNAEGGTRQHSLPAR
jgi:hypothetical protein